eukprot:11151487-Ditylum_brightwellii.AAC.1
MGCGSHNMGVRNVLPGRHPSFVMQPPQHHVDHARCVASSTQEHSIGTKQVQLGQGIGLVTKHPAQRGHPDESRHCLCIPTEHSQALHHAR